MDLNELEIREYLIGIAKEKRTVNYKIIMDKCGEKTFPSTVRNKLTIPILDPISEKNINQKEPLLAALVVNKNTGIPGDDFFDKWMRLPTGSYPYPPEGLENQEIHELELKQVYEYWHDRNYKTTLSSPNITSKSNMPSTESLNELNDVDTKKLHTPNTNQLENSMVKKPSIINLLNPSAKIGIVLGAIIGLMMNAIIVGLVVGLIVGAIIDIIFRKDNESALYGLTVGSVMGAIFGVLIVSIISNNSTGVGFVIGVIVGGVTGFKILFENKKIRVLEDNKNKEQVKNSIDIEVETKNSLKLGVENPVKITVNNNSKSLISNVYLKSNFPKSVICNENIAFIVDDVPDELSKSEQRLVTSSIVNETLKKIDIIHAKSSESKTLFLTPTVVEEINLGNLIVTLEIDDYTYEKEPVEIGVFDVLQPEIDIQIDVPKPFKVGMENPVKITVKNQSDVLLSNIQIETHFSRLITCDETIVHTDDIPANSSEYTAIFITPRIADKINLGELDISYNINDNTYKKEPIAIGTYEAIEVNSYKPEKYIDNVNSDISISRETEFYQGFIRFKMSVTNTSSFVVNDVTLDYDYDNNLLRIDRREPDYQIKNGRTIFGNISANSSKTIAVYFDPMMCSKGADINCQVNYKDAKGQPQTTHMKPKQISVVCPIMETESDINIGRLKEFIEKLPYRDSKVYQIQNGFDIDVLKNISREIVQKHDVKHIRTLFTKDGNTCEIWYYGKTKVHGHDIVIKITILSETKSIELFAATETVESLAGLLAEVGRELKGEIESKVTGNVQQIINVSIKDSIVQRSNLLSHCDINGNCSGDVVIEDSLVQRSNINTTVEFENDNKGVVKKMNDSELSEHLIDIVKNNSNIEEIKVEYNEVLTHFGYEVNQGTQRILRDSLNRISHANHQNNEPFLAAIVVGKRNIVRIPEKGAIRIPGEGFFDLMREHRNYDGSSDGLEAQKIHEEELKRVFNYWHSDNKNSCSACGEVVPDGAKFCMECGGKLI